MASVEWPGHPWIRYANISPSRPVQHKGTLSDGCPSRRADGSHLAAAQKLLQQGDWRSSSCFLARTTLRLLFYQNLLKLFLRRALTDVFGDRPLLGSQRRLQRPITAVMLCESDLCGLYGSCALGPCHLPAKKPCQIAANLTRRLYALTSWPVRPLRKGIINAYPA